MTNCAGVEGGAEGRGAVVLEKSGCGLWVDTIIFNYKLT